MRFFDTDGITVNFTVGKIVPYNKISLRYLKLGVYLSCVLMANKSLKSLRGGQPFTAQLQVHLHKPSQKNNKTKQMNSSHVYARTFIFTLSFLWLLVGIIGQIR